MIALLAVLVACSGRVELLTAPPAPANMGDPMNCRANGTMGRLAADPTFGTVLMTDWSPPFPVAWPLGDYGRRVKGGEIQVLTQDGKAVITTGPKTIRISGSFVTIGNVSAFLICAL